MNNNGILEKLEFNEFLTKLGVFLSTQELRTVYDHFDLNRDGGISYVELVSVLRNTSSEKRTAAIKAAFAQLARGQPSITLPDLMVNFKAHCHPRVQAR